ncbi:hypothetical protein [Cystobacter ferrugineus]|uniref:Uncharacterized protein n=1 Tax=Cystobacter ferrugineus TaxID=83449 RepID=A0A1L9B1A4_9BACT|nr:hypothetical protein [Cystobacter ferrugineus]OJH36044.1 hypothetical protein BON30_36215 [Cystobacter ferrugineus]
MFSRLGALVQLAGFVAASYLYIRYLASNAGQASPSHEPINLLDYCATIFALLPSLLVLGHFIAKRRRSPRIHIQTIQEYLRFRENIFRKGRHSENKLISQNFLRFQDEKELDSLLRPRPSQYLVSICALALCFLVLSIYSDALHGIRGTLPDKGAGGQFYEEGIRGLVFTGYGVYVYTLIVILHRMRAQTLSTECLLGAALRVITMMVIGFMVGETGLFLMHAMHATSNVTSSSSEVDSSAMVSSSMGLVVYFAIGAFPFWGYEALREKARKLLQPKASSEKIPLEYVSGLDEMIIERLEELGVSNVQHLATYDPVLLALRTNYPLKRIIDWIDQAILAVHLQDKIRFARELGIRGATDLRHLYADIQKGRPTRYFRIFRQRYCAHCGQFKPGSAEERARALLQELANRTQSSIESIHAIGAKLTADIHVLLLGGLQRE